MKMTFDAEACAAYIQLAPAISTVDDSWPLDCDISGIHDVIVDIKADGRVLGIEILGQPGDGPETILAAIADERIAVSLASEGFDCPMLRGNPDITIHHID